MIILEREEEERERQRNLEEIEAQKKKHLLMKFNWEKKFDEYNFMFRRKKHADYLSEQEEVQGRRMRNIKCGKILWSGIFYCMYLTLYLILLLWQLRVTTMYEFNSALTSVIEGVQFMEP